MIPAKQRRRWMLAVDEGTAKARESAMRRNITRELLEWKESGMERMPMVLYGARQVGKTYVLQEFANNYYKNSIYINFERMPFVAAYFDGDLSPDRLVRCLEEYFSEKIIPEETLLIFDEVQSCERALTSLKYFCEEAPEYPVIAAGSLLGVAVHREKFSFPVGKVVLKTLYPLSFDEFLEAAGNSHYVSMIQDAYAEKRPLAPEIHEELLLWYKRYLFIGGMPAAINQYLQSGSLVNVPEIQNMILAAYTADMAKYASAGESTKIRNAYLSMPAQLARENKKFQYKLIRKGATAGLFGDSIAWLHMAGLVYECRRVTRGELPIEVFRDVSAFKLYLSDVGLLSAFANILPENIIRDDLSDVYRGALAENYVAQALAANGYHLYYWTSDSPAAEVDFLIQKQGKVYPVEVKSGKNVHARSLKHYRKIHPEQQVYRISERNFGMEEGVCSVPLYAVFCI